jgi:hypothetical protein
VKFNNVLLIPQRGRLPIVEALLTLYTSLGFEVFPAYFLKGNAPPANALLDSPVRRNGDDEDWKIRKHMQKSDPASCPSASPRRGWWPRAHCQATAARQL